MTLRERALFSHLRAIQGTKPSVLKEDLVAHHSFYDNGNFMVLLEADTCKSTL